MARAGLHGFCL
jgi:hypothetical protein